MKNLIWTALVISISAVIVLMFAVRPSSIAVASANNIKADEFITCAAYYQTTANALENDQDEQVVTRYRQRSAIATKSAADLSNRSVIDAAKEQNIISDRLAVELSSSDADLGSLAVRYDDMCLALLGK